MDPRGDQLMTDKRAETRSSGSKRRRVERQDDREIYKGHEVLIPRGDPGRRVLIDGEPVRYGQIGDRYYLPAYAYDSDTSLVEVVRRFIDYRDAAAARRAKEAGR
jgi:hypothetical protein